MKLTNLFPFALLLLFVVACEDDDDPVVLAETNLAIDFRAEFDDFPLAIQSGTYAYPTGEEMKVLLFQYYISDLELLPADGGAPVPLADIDLIRYETAGGDATVSRTYDAPVGEYRGLRFGLGVSPDLNAQEPSNFAADFVLNEAEFWGPAARYVFAKIEANADLENDDTFDTGLTYHMGSDAQYTTLTFTQNFSIGDNQAPKITLVADVLDALSGNGETFDIRDPDKQRVHGGNQAVAQDIWDRLVGQFRLEMNP